MAKAKLNLLAVILVSTSLSNTPFAAHPLFASFVKAALEENNLLRRPITIRDGQAVVGKSEAEIKKLFG